MSIQFLLERFQQYGEREALIWRDRSLTYVEMLEGVHSAAEQIEEAGISAGDVVALIGDFSPQTSVMLLALTMYSCVLVPLSVREGGYAQELKSAQVEWVMDMSDSGVCRIQRTGYIADHALIQQLREMGHPGLILYSSGSTGTPKAMIHDATRLLAKFRTTRKKLRAISFLMFDHMGGFNTFFSILSSGGTVVTVPERTPSCICEMIEKHRVQLLPATPTFLNLLLISEVYGHYDLSSLEQVTFGTEVATVHTLQRFQKIFPHVQLSQTYGLSELGILRAKSRENGSLWVKIGGEGYQTRIVDEKLEIKAEAMMLGYLNAESPLTEDGWFQTGDMVEVDGEYLRILGRASELINIGGEKVYPSEVENVLQEMEGVEEVVVTGIPNVLTGQVVAAHVILTSAETAREFKTRMRKFCQNRLRSYQIPQKVFLVKNELHSDRLKKVRRFPSYSPTQEGDLVDLEKLTL